MVIKDDELIREEYSKNPKRFWGWLLFLFLVILLIFALQWGLKRTLEGRVCKSPFFRVTNREMSVFLWQNPELLRVHQKKKMGYLPGFQYLDKVSLEPELDKAWVVAPPEVLFAYHTWARLLGEVWIATPILVSDFKNFLNYAEEWKIENWKEAPKE